MSNGHVNLNSHPLVQYMLSVLRLSDSGVKEYRDILPRLSTLLIYESMRDLRTHNTKVKTPLGVAEAQVVGPNIVFVPIWRAGDAMLEGALSLFPEAQVLHVGVARDDQSLKPKAYYSRLPELDEHSLHVVLDPMLATGGTLVWVVTALKAAGAKHIIYVGLIGSKRGVGKFHDIHADVPVHVAAVDSHLNKKGYIVPGLGDAGDRYFGTKPSRNMK